MAYGRAKKSPISDLRGRVPGAPISMTELWRLLSINYVRGTVEMSLHAAHQLGLYYVVKANSSRLEHMLLHKLDLNIQWFLQFNTA